MIIRIQLDDGSEMLLTAEELAQAFLNSLKAIRAPEPEPERCPHCQFGRIATAYCSCSLGRDLKRIESRMMANPVGGVDA